MAVKKRICYKERLKCYNTSTISGGSPDVRVRIKYPHSGFFKRLHTPKTSEFSEGLGVCGFFHWGLPTTNDRYAWIVWNMYEKKYFSCSLTTFVTLFVRSFKFYFNGNNKHSKIPQLNSFVSALNLLFRYLKVLQKNLGKLYFLTLWWWLCCLKKKRPWYLLWWCPWCP